MLRAFWDWWSRVRWRGGREGRALLSERQEGHLCPHPHSSTRVGCDAPSPSSTITPRTHTLAQYRPTEHRPIHRSKRETATTETATHKETEHTALPPRHTNNAGVRGPARRRAHGPGGRGPPPRARDRGRPQEGSVKRRREPSPPPPPLPRPKKPPRRSPAPLATPRASLDRRDLDDGHASDRIAIAAHRPPRIPRAPWRARGLRDERIGGGRSSVEGRGQRGRAPAAAVGSSPVPIPGSDPFIKRSTHTTQIPTSPQPSQNHNRCRLHQERPRLGEQAPRRQGVRWPTDPRRRDHRPPDRVVLARG